MNSPAGSEILRRGLAREADAGLEAAAPIYHAHLWPDHDRANRRWIMRVARRARTGRGCQNGLRTFTRHAGARKIRVDVTGYANWTAPIPRPIPRVTISSWTHAIRAPQPRGASTRFARIAEPVQAASSASAASAIKPSSRPLARLVFYHR